MTLQCNALRTEAVRAFNAKKQGGHDVNKEFDWFISTTTNHTLTLGDSQPLHFYERPPGTPKPRY